MSSKVGISRYMVTNVLPYTPEMCDEVLYHRAIERVAWQASPWHPHVIIVAALSHSAHAQCAYEIVAILDLPPCGIFQAYRNPALILSMFITTISIGLLVYLALA
jgi:hypothetical protein